MALLLWLSIALIISGVVSMPNPQVKTSRYQPSKPHVRPVLIDDVGQEDAVLHIPQQSSNEKWMWNWQTPNPDDDLTQMTHGHDHHGHDHHVHLHGYDSSEEGFESMEKEDSGLDQVEQFGQEDQFSLDEVPANIGNEHGHFKPTERVDQGQQFEQGEHFGQVGEDFHTGDLGQQFEETEHFGQGQEEFGQGENLGHTHTEEGHGHGREHETVVHGNTGQEDDAIGQGQEFGQGQDFGQGEQFGQGEDFGKGEQFGQGEDFGKGEQVGQGEDFDQGQQFGQGEDFGKGEQFGQGEDFGQGQQFAQGEEFDTGMFDQTDQIAQDAAEQHPGQFLSFDYGQQSEDAPLETLGDFDQDIVQTAQDMNPLDASPGSAGHEDEYVPVQTPPPGFADKLERFGNKIKEKAAHVGEKVKEKAEKFGEKVKEKVGVVAENVRNFFGKLG